MKWFYDLKISAKLLIGFITVAMIAGIVGIVGIKNMTELDKSDVALYKNAAVPISLLADLTTQFQRMRVNIRDMIIADNQEGAEGIQDFKTRIYQRKADIDRISADLDKTIISSRIRTSLNEFVAVDKDFDNEIDKVTLLAEKNKDTEALELIKEESPLGKASRAEQNAIDSLIKLAVGDAKAKSTSNTRQASGTMTVMMIVIFLGVLGAIGIGIFLSSIISKPVKSLILAADKLAVGDINVEIKSKTKDEIGTLMSSLAKMVSNIKEQSNIAKRITEGDLSIVIQPKSDNDVMAKSMKAVVDTLKSLAVESQLLTTAAVEGRLGTRGNGDLFKGGYRDIIEGVNKTLDVLGNYIGSLPPVVVMDKDFAIQYINRAGSDLLGLTPNQIIGTKCYDHFKTSHCNTKKCACAQAMQLGRTVTEETDAHPVGMNLDISYTGIPQKNEKQEIVSVLEFVVNQTDIKNATRIAKKQADYQEKEVQKLVTNLEKLAKGDLSVESDVAPTDADTMKVGENFAKMANSLEKSIKAINLMVTDASMLSNAAVEGKLDVRADSSKHEGEFRKIVDGVNNTLDAVIAPIKEAADVLEEMSKVNFDVSVTGDYKGDHALIKNSLNSTIDSINELLSQINHVSEQVALGSEQIASSGQNLSQGTTEQASSIEEITSSMAMIAAKTKDNALNANKANEFTVAAKENAGVGNEQMNGMVKAMQEINDSSDNISKIIKVIDEIAFQTNILALNAAVEAARAGQHGKGFAVVAEEVRNLAARSADAAKETSEMIEDSIKKVQAGTKMADVTAQALNRIVNDVTKASELVAGISVSSNEQATAISQMNIAIDQVAQVVQTTSATAEESAAASEELSGQAELLKETVGRFILRRTNNLHFNIGNKLNPDVLKAIEQIIEKKTLSNKGDKNNGVITKSKYSESNKKTVNTVKSANADFGKY